MALRKIRVEGDEVLTKVSRPVEKMTPRIHDLIEDMLDTMYDAMGVGLAAPQVGMLKRIVVIDVGEGPLVLINPEILELKGELVTEEEGCLSCPGISVPECRREYAVVKFTVSVGVPDEVFEIVPMHRGQIVFTHVREHGNKRNQNGKTVENHVRGKRNQNNGKTHPLRGVPFFLPLVPRVLIFFFRCDFFSVRFCHYYLLPYNSCQHSVGGVCRGLRMFFAE